MLLVLPCSCIGVSIFFPLARKDYLMQRALLRAVRGGALDCMDTVWLLLQENPQYALYSNAGPYITFSGYLVYPDVSSNTGYVNNHLPPPALPFPGCPSPGDYGWTRREESAE